MPNLLDRLAKKLNRKLAATAVTMGAESHPTTATPAAVTQIQKDEAEQTEA